MEDGPALKASKTAKNLFGDPIVSLPPDPAETSLFGRPITGCLPPAPAGTCLFGRPNTGCFPPGAEENPPKAAATNLVIRLARAALRPPAAARDKDKEAMEAVVRLRNGLAHYSACTLCLVYNATGEAVDLATSYDWAGRAASPRYPERIANGQWGFFLHLQAETAPPAASAGAVVYRGRNEDGKPCDFLVAWSNGEWGKGVRLSRCYTEVAEWKHYEKLEHWDDMYRKVQRSRLVESSSWYKCEARVKIDDQKSPVLEAILSVKGAGDLLDFHFEHVY